MQEMEQERLGPDHTSYHLAMDAAGRGSGEGIWTFDLPSSCQQYWNSVKHLIYIYSDPKQVDPRLAWFEDV